MEIQVFNTKSEYVLALKEVVVQATGTYVTTGCSDQSLYQIIIKSQGAYPIDVVSTLNTLGICYQEDYQAYRVETSKSNTLTPTIHCSLFADPHPADYDWRFSVHTIEALTQKLLTSARGGKIALLGTKTVFPPLYDQGAKVTLFNKSKSILNDLRAAGYNNGLVECDLSFPLTADNASYQVVFADPPWYLDYYRAFMHRAASLLSIGGTMYLSVMPCLTRPGAVEDQATILEIAVTLGLQLIKQDAGYLFYETPGFEYQALLSCGLFCDDWRRGDLWVFRKQHEISPGLSDRYVIDEPDWIEYRIGSKRIKVKSTSSLENVQFTYSAVDPNGAVMTHVSRRSPLRNKIDVWSSDNQAYKVTRISLLQQCLGQLEANWSMSEVIAAMDTHRQLDWEEQANLIALLRELV